jgi:hypothetical protein
MCDLLAIVVDYKTKPCHGYGQSQVTLEPGLVNVKTGSVFSFGQQRPRLELTGMV